MDYEPSHVSKYTHKPLLPFLLSLLLLLLLPLDSLGQSDYRLRGRVYDSVMKEWAHTAGVRLLHAKDSTLVRGVATGEKGIFDFKGLKAGNYLLTVSFVGYKPIEKSVRLKEKKLVDLGTLTLEPNTTALQGVVVTGEARPMILKTDTVEFNASSFKVRDGAMVEELLRQLPGVEVDADGNITYNGEKIEGIEVDGKEFFSSDPKMASQNLPSLMVEKVQVVDKKSEETRLTGMDDGSRTKIPNLQVKPEMKRGVVANTSGGYGTKDRYSLDFMVNYFNKDSRLTGTGRLDNTFGVRRGNGDRTSRNLGINYDNTWKDKLELTLESGYDGNTNKRIGSRRVENLLGNNRSNINNNNYDDRSGNDSFHLGSRMKWTPDTLTTIFIRPNMDFSKDHSESQSTFRTVDQEGIRINEGSSSSSSEGQNLSAGLGVDARRRLNDRGRQIYVGADGDLSRSQSTGNTFSKTLLGAETNERQELIDQLNDNENSSQSVSLRTSYIEPLTSKISLELNYRISMQSRKNDRRAYNKDANGEYTILDEVYSKGSSNTNRNHRIGLRGRYAVGRNQLYLGFNAMPTYTHTISTIGTKEVYNTSRTVWNYAPSLRFFYRPTDSLDVTVHYRGRTSQPSLEQLNPALYIQSPLHRTQGNPNLLPAFSHNINYRVSFNRPSRRQTLGSRGDFSVTNNAVVDRRTINPKTGQTMTTYENVSGLLSANFGMMGSTPLGKTPLNLFFFGNMSYSKSKAYVNDQLNTSYTWAPIIAPTLSWNAPKFNINLGGSVVWQNVKNTIAEDRDRNTVDYSIRNYLNFTLPWDFYLNSQFSFNARRGYGGDADTNTSIWNATLGKTFLANRAASLELSVYDILGQRTSYRRNVTPTAITDTQVNNITTYALLTFRYRFNSFGAGKEPSIRDNRGRGFHHRGGGRRF